MSDPLYNICVVCKKQFVVKPSSASRRKACSKACQAIWYKERLKGAGNPHYKGKQLTKTCVVCEREFTYYASVRDAICCSTACAAEHRSRVYVGELNPAWNGGSINYYGPNWLAQKRAVLNRDDNTCQHCGATFEELGKLPHVHHIKPFRCCANYLEANVLSNLISLCHTCHRKAEQVSREIYGLPDYQSDIELPDTYYTPEEVAQFLNLTTWAIYGRINRGQIKAINIKDDSTARPRYMIPESELDNTPQPRYMKPTKLQIGEAKLLLGYGNHSHRAIARATGLTYAAVRKLSKS